MKMSVTGAPGFAALGCARAVAAALSPDAIALAPTDNASSNVTETQRMRIRDLVAPAMPCLPRIQSRGPHKRFASMVCSELFGPDVLFKTSQIPDVPVRVAHSLFARPNKVQLPAARSPADAHLMDARAALAAGDDAWALEAFTAALRSDPANRLALAGRLACLAALGREEEMRDEMEADLRRDGAGVIELARLSAAQGRTALALNVIRVAMQARPDLGHAFVDDPRLAKLKDHPLFLQITGAL